MAMIMDWILLQEAIATTAMENNWTSEKRAEVERKMLVKMYGKKVAAIVLDGEDSEYPKPVPHPDDMETVPMNNDSVTVSRVMEGE